MAVRYKLVLNTNGLFEIYNDAGGPVPQDLSGVYTSEKIVKIAIANYVTKVQDKAKQTTPKRRANSNSK